VPCSVRIVPCSIRVVQCSNSTDQYWQLAVHLPSTLKSWSDTLIGKMTMQKTANTAVKLSIWKAGNCNLANRHGLELSRIHFLVLNLQWWPAFKLWRIHSLPLAVPFFLYSAGKVIKGGKLAWVNWLWIAHHDGLTKSSCHCFLRHDWLLVCWHHYLHGKTSLCFSVIRMGAPARTQLIMSWKALFNNYYSMLLI